MRSESKLKRSRTYMPGLIMGIVAVMYFFGAIVESRMFGTSYSTWLYGAAIILYCVFLFFRYRHIAFVESIFILLSGILVGSAAWHYELAEHAETVLSEKTFQIHVLIMGIYFLITVPLILIRRKTVGLYSRQIFEIAARPVSDAADGFTARPYPAGRARYSREEIVGFAKYLSRKLIVVSYTEDDGVILGFSPGVGHFTKPDLGKLSYVSFDFDGNVSVNMARKDYEQYKEELTFDQLCGSLGDLFKSFLGYYQNGERERIIEMLHSRGIRLKRYIILGLSVLVFGLFILGAALYFLVAGLR